MVDNFFLDSTHSPYPPLICTFSFWRQPWLSWNSNILLPLSGYHILLSGKSVSSLLLVLHFLNIFKGTTPKTKQILTSGKRTKEEKIIGMDFSSPIFWYINTHTHWVGFCLFTWRFEHTHKIIFVYESHTIVSQVWWCKGFASALTSGSHGQCAL